MRRVWSEQKGKKKYHIANEKLVKTDGKELFTVLSKF